MRVRGEGEGVRVRVILLLPFSLYRLLSHAREREILGLAHFTYIVQSFWDHLPLCRSCSQRREPFLAD